MSQSTLENWIKANRHLPEPLRDEHDQKALFKLIDRVAVEPHKNDTFVQVMGLPNWCQAHVYVIEIFLRYMAERGYTLQKSSAKFKFKRLSQD